MVKLAVVRANGKYPGNTPAVAGPPTHISSSVAELGGLDLTGKAAVLKTAGRKPVQVRVLCPPLSPVTPCGPGLIECARAHLPVLSRRHARSPAELERERRRDSGHRHGSPSADHGLVRAVDVSPCEGPRGSASRAHG